MLDTLSPGQIPTTVAPEPRKTRRTYPREFKATIVSECLKGERSVASIALEHGVNANLIHKWIRHTREECSAPKMLPVSAPTMEVPQADDARIELSVSGITIRLYGHVEAHSLRVLLGALQ